MGNMTMIEWLWICGPAVCVAVLMGLLWRYQYRRVLQAHDAATEQALQLTETLARQAREIESLRAAQPSEVVPPPREDLARDALTDLPERALFDDRLQTALHQGHRYHRTVALLRVQLDRRDEIDATLGHDAADQMRAEAAQRLCGCVRESDTVARLGRDDFAILLFEAEGHGEVEQVAQRVVDALRAPYHLDAGTTHNTGSVGLALYPRHGADSASLLRRAEAALHEVLALGGNAWRLPEPPAGDAQQQGALL